VLRMAVAQPVRVAFAERRCCQQSPSARIWRAGVADVVPTKLRQRRPRSLSVALARSLLRGYSYLLQGAASRKIPFRVDARFAESLPRKVFCFFVTFANRAYPTVTSMHATGLAGPSGRSTCVSVLLYTPMPHIVADIANAYDDRNAQQLRSQSPRRAGSTEFRQTLRPSTSRNQRL